MSKELRGVAYVRATLLSKDADDTHGTEWKEQGRENGMNIK